MRKQYLEAGNVLNKGVLRLLHVFEELVLLDVLVLLQEPCDLVHDCRY